MKMFFKKSECWIVLIVLGVIITIGSLVYNFAISNHNIWIMSSLFIINASLLFINVYFAFSLIIDNWKKNLINTFIGCLLYICFFITLGLCLVEGAVTLEFFLEILKTAIFVGPSVVLFFFVCYMLG